MDSGRGKSSVVALANLKQLWVLRVHKDIDHKIDHLLIAYFPEIDAD